MKGKRHESLVKDLQYTEDYVIYLKSSYTLLEKGVHCKSIYFNVKKDD